MASNTEALINAARKAGQAAKQWREKQLRENGHVPTATKSDGSIVTKADRIAQKKIQRISIQVDSEAEFIGEEEDARKANLATFSPGTRLFVVDPIDGTKYFVLGKPTWSVSIAYAVVEQGNVDVEKTLKTLAAVVYAPDKGNGELYYADEGGAFFERDGKRGTLYARAASSAILPVMTFYCKKIADTDDTEPMRKAMLQAAEDINIYTWDANTGSPALSLAAAAQCTNNVVVTREDNPFNPVTAGAVAPWDTLAGRFIYRMAGGKVPSDVDLHGNLLVGGNLIISVMAPSEGLANDAAAALKTAAMTRAKP